MVKPSNPSKITNQTIIAHPGGYKLPGDFDPSTVIEKPPPRCYAPDRRALPLQWCEALHKEAANDGMMRDDRRWQCENDQLLFLTWIFDDL